MRGLSHNAARLQRRSMRHWLSALVMAVVASLLLSSPAGAAAPTAPGQPSVIAGNEQVTVSWTSVTSSPATTAYTVIALDSDQNQVTQVSVDATSGSSVSAIVTGLTNGSSYTFKVTARNADGSSAYSVASSAATPFTTPNAPALPTLTVGNAQLTATWTAVTNTNGSAITGYTASASASGSVVATCSTTGSTTLTCDITGLTNGTAYSVTVVATNSAGDSNASASASGTPATTPGAPTGVEGTAGDTSAVLSWTAPNANGGSAITSYQAVATPGGQACTSADGSTTTCTVTGLTNGTAYTFRVTATTAIGAGTASSASAEITPVGNPGMSTGLSGTPDNASVVLTWVAPADTGGSAITDYVVQYSSNSGTTWFTFADGTSATASTRVTGLTNGTGYIFRVNAVNAQGSGTATAASSVVTPVTTPTAATLVAGTAGNAQVGLTWTAPSDNGGSSITDYTIEYSSDTGTTWTTFTDGTSVTTSATVTGLTNGTAYTFRVSPINAQGTGTVSTASAAVVPVTTPGIPTAASATANGTDATVTWLAPSSTGGSVITGYKIESSIDGGTTWGLASADTLSTAVSASFADLTSGASYSFRISAINAVGIGNASTASTAVQTGPTAAEVNTWLATNGAANFLAILAFAGEQAAQQVAEAAAATQAWLDTDDARRFLGLPTKAEEEAATEAWLATAEAAAFLGVDPVESPSSAATEAWLATDEAARFLASLA